MLLPFSTCYNGCHCTVCVRFQYFFFYNVCLVQMPAFIWLCVTFTITIDFYLGILLHNWVESRVYYDSFGVLEIELTLLTKLRELKKKFGE